MVNSTKLNENLIHITDNQEGWRQEHWAESITETGDIPPTPGACGTSFCLAGWAVVNEGIALDWKKTTRYNLTTGKDEYVWSANTTKDGRDIPSVAQDILGLPDPDMFAGGNSLAKLWSMAERESLGKIKRPANAPQGDGYGNSDCDCEECQDEEDSF